MYDLESLFENIDEFTEEMLKKVCDSCGVVIDSGLHIIDE